MERIELQKKGPEAKPSRKILLKLKNFFLVEEAKLNNE